MKKIIISAAVASVVFGAGTALAGGASPEAVQKVLSSSFKDPDKSTEFAVTPSWASRLTQDKLQQVCSEAHGKVDQKAVDAIQTEAKASIKYPEDGKFLGDWKNGERIAQDGRGMRFNDKADTKSGGNCYACHQIDKTELAYGTIGPSLTGYGKLKDFSDEAVKATYEKIYNSHVVVPCSHMPRFGTSGILSIDQIKDLVALLMDKNSPVNK